MMVHRENMIQALTIAIRFAEENGHGKCALVEGWRAALQALECGQTVLISAP